HSVIGPAAGVIAFVLGLTLVFLTVVFRSLVVGATSVVLNLLSVGAAYGLLVLVFQDGVASGLLGFHHVDTIEAWVPLFLFSVLFGLSMDYQVFLLSRIRERYDETRDTTGSVTFGVASTARIITGAALIIVAVFSGFAAGQLVMFQQMGFGVAVALLIDATIIRSVVLPSVMGLLVVAAGILAAALTSSSGARSSSDADLSLLGQKRSVFAGAVTTKSNKIRSVPSQFECTALSGGANTKLDCDDPFPNNEPDI